MSKEDKKITKKKLIENAKVLIKSYHEIQVREKDLADGKKTIRKEIENCFDGANIDLLDVTENSKKIRAQRYVSQTIDYDVKKLLPILKKAGIHKKVIKLSVDSKALDDAYNQGLISLDDIKGAVSVKTSKVFKVQEVK